MMNTAEEIQKTSNDEDAAGTARVYVIDDTRDVRDAVCHLARAAGYEAVDFEAAEQFFDYAKGRTLAGCIVLDYRMPRMNGLEVYDLILEAEFDLPTIMVTAFGDIGTAVKALKSGMFEFLEKPFNETTLIGAIDRAMQEDLTRAEARARRCAARSLMERLTKRETEILFELARGKAAKEIAFELGLSRKTVDVHRFRILKKLETDNVVHTVRLLQDAGYKIAR